MRIFRHYWNDKVSLILLLLFVAGGIRSVFIDGYVLGAFLFIAALYNVFMVNERGRFIAAILLHFDYDPLILAKLGLQGASSRRRKSFFEISVLFLIYLGSLILLFLVLLKLLTGDF